MLNRKIAEGVLVLTERLSFPDIDPISASTKTFYNYKPRVSAFIPLHYLSFAFLTYCLTTMAKRKASRKIPVKKNNVPLGMSRDFWQHSISPWTDEVLACLSSEYL